MKTLIKTLSGFVILAFICSMSMKVDAADQTLGADGNRVVAEKTADTHTDDAMSSDSMDKKEMKAAPKNDMHKDKRPMKHAKKDMRHDKGMHKGHTKKAMKKDMKKDKREMKQDMKKEEGAMMNEHTDAEEKY